MLEERFRLMYLSRNGSDIKYISLNIKKFFLVATFSLIMLSMVIAGMIGVFTRVYHNYRIVSLQNDKEHLQKELLGIKEKVSTLSQRLAQVESTGDDLRNVASLPPIDSDIRQVGVGGPDAYSSLDMGYYPDETTRMAMEVKLDLDKLERVIRLEKSSMSEITAKLRAHQNQIDHLPTICPILGGIITSGFGLRSDPFTNKLTPHKGIDIPMPRGTPIFATGDGIIKVVKTNYTPNKNYGKYIIVDHGFGYTTLYGHCDEILVRQGEKVKRWQLIARVGKTGRAEGFHLHYEVRCDNEKVDPEYYIFN